MTQWTLYTDDTPIGIMSALHSSTNSKIFKAGTPLEKVLSGTYAPVLVVGNFSTSSDTVNAAASLPPYHYLPTYEYEGAFSSESHYDDHETNWLQLYNLLKANNLIATSDEPIYKAYNDFVLLPNENYEAIYTRFKEIEPKLIKAKFSKYGCHLDDMGVKVAKEDKEDYVSKKLARRYQFTKGDLQVSVVKADMYMHEIALRCQIDSTKLGYKNAVFVQNGNFVVVHKSPEVNIMDSLGIDNLEQVGNTYSFFMDNLEDYTLAEALRGTLNEA